MVAASPPPGYLDAASGQPLNPAAEQAWAAAATAAWPNPGRLYGAGRRAGLLEQAARESFAVDLGVPTDGVRFTTGAMTAIRDVIRQCVPHNGTVVVSAVEHSEVLAAADDIAAAGGESRVVGVDHAGRLNVDAFVAALPGADLACVQTANHEVGTRQPIAAAATACAAAGVPLLLDASQSLGHEPAPQGWTLLFGQAFSWGGPAGTGLLAIADPRLRASLRPPIAGLAEAVVTARAWEWARDHRADEALRARLLTDRLLAEVVRDTPLVSILGDPADRLPHLVAFSCLYVDGEALVHGLDRAGFAVSSGSSCVSDTRRPSHVLAAMGALTQGNVRVSLPYGTAESTVTDFVAALPRVVSDVRAMLGAPDSPGASPA